LDPGRVDVGRKVGEGEEQVGSRKSQFVAISDGFSNSIITSLTEMAKARTNAAAPAKAGAVVRARRIVHRHPGAPANERRPGLRRNPSAFWERLPILGLALIGFAVACYLALYQLGIIADVWDPLFADGSRKVLHSAVSQMLPVPDASLGALGYLADIVTCAVGGAARWRTMPWMVLVYGGVVALVGATALALAILQPLLVHDGCTLCLTSAAISLIVVWLAREEVFASIAQVRARKLRELFS
jgi:uncharacterized membrane protein